MADEAQAIINMDVESNGEGEENEEFYENIEAPKFVDFTTADHYHPDDRYWFCLRVGCDQKHEEELDPEAISKNFVLRVMAARSPNVRFQKALNRTASSKYMKCPGSAPPKSSKSRLSRLALISSFSGKLVDHERNVKVKPLSKLTSTTTSTTPKMRTKQVAAKYLTTPRNKKCLPNPNSFRSVQNPKPTTLDVPKTRTIAKALVFHSPRKGIAVKTSVELRTPLTKLCDGMKRLELSSPKKRALGCSSKLAKDPGLSSNKSLPVKSSRKLRVTFKDQINEKTPLQSQTGGARETKQSRSLKRETKGNLTRKVTEEHSSAKKMLEKCSSTDKKLEETGLSEMTPLAETPDLLLVDVSKELESTDQTEVEGEVMESDDKENASVFDENRDCNHNNSEIRKKGTEEAPGNIKRTLEKNPKEATKFRKPKPTNPKPFRFRTDERGILKEANLEKKVHLQAPKKESAKGSRCLDASVLEKPVGCQDKCNDENLLENTQSDSQRTILSDSSKGNRINISNTPEGKEALELDTTTSPLNSNCSRSKKIISPLKRDLVQPQRLPSSRKGVSSCMIHGQQLSVIKEISPLVSKPSVTDSALPRRRRQVTIPKGPNFHSTHRPKSCTKQMAS